MQTKTGRCTTMHASCQAGIKSLGSATRLLEQDLEPYKWLHPHHPVSNVSDQRVVDSNRRARLRGRLRQDAHWPAESWARHVLEERDLSQSPMPICNGRGVLGLYLLRTVCAWRPCDCSLENLGHHLLLSFIHPLPLNFPCVSSITRLPGSDESSCEMCSAPLFPSTTTVDASTTASGSGRLGLIN